MTLAGFAALLSLPAFAQSDDTPSTAGQVVGETIFAFMDSAGRGMIYSGDIEQFRSASLDGMNYDSNGKVTYKEFSGWNPGFSYIAQNEGRLDAYTTAYKASQSWSQCARRCVPIYKYMVGPIRKAPSKTTALFPLQSIG